MIKILSKAKDEFEIDGVEILPGVDTYKLDTKKRHIRYQLATLKSEGIIDFNELLEWDDEKDGLPVDAKKAKADAEALQKKAAARRERMGRNRKRQVKEAKKKAEEAARKAELDAKKKAKEEADAKALKKVVK